MCGCGGNKATSAVQRINAQGPISSGPAAPLAGAAPLNFGAAMVRPLSNVNPKAMPIIPTISIETEQDRKRIAKLRQEAIRAALNK